MGFKIITTSVGKPLSKVPLKSTLHLLSSVVGYSLFGFRTLLYYYIGFNGFILIPGPIVVATVMLFINCPFAAAGLALMIASISVL